MQPIDNDRDALVRPALASQELSLNPTRDLKRFGRIGKHRRFGLMDGGVDFGRCSAVLRRDW
ncbi:hypothetical protein [Sphingomonas sp. CCH18-H6]|uniref:hypothetical protein n=1 Tax=Sphingomonas sp. CCH18-H6 TaxID=1768787 RepID=UPI001E2861B2|nr:hypothetical protein [Sphingomonas sp. CCH18-H6]